jgi:hypothetical protein
VYLEPWQIIGLAFVAAFVGGFIVRAGLGQQLASLQLRLIVMGGDLAVMKNAIESVATSTRFQIEEAESRIIDRLDPDKRAERHTREMQRKFPGYGAP